MMTMNAMPFKLTGVIFDMDGLMLDTERIYHSTWRTAGAELGYHLSDELLLSTIGRTFPDCYQLLRATLGEHFPLAAFQKLWPVHWHQHVAQYGIPQKPGLVELLDLLDQRGIRKAMATSTTYDEALFTLHAGQIENRFQVIVTGEQVQHGKPAPDIFLEAARRPEVDPRGCLAVEDSEAGVLAAASAGMYTIMVPDTKQPSAEVAVHAKQILPSLYEVRGWIEYLDRLATGDQVSAAIRNGLYDAEADVDARFKAQATG
jgi:HAD superfamily hydrolase (TIGR01509 family)